MALHATIYELIIWKWKSFHARLMCCLNNYYFLSLELSRNDFNLDGWNCNWIPLHEYILFETMAYGCRLIEKLDSRSGTSTECTSSINTYLQTKRKKLLIFLFKLKDQKFRVSFLWQGKKNLNNEFEARSLNIDGSTIRSIFIVFGIWKQPTISFNWQSLSQPKMNS